MTPPAVGRCLCTRSLYIHGVTIHVLFFFFNDTATTEIYTLSLHDALPIWRRPARDGGPDSPLLANRLNVSRGRSSGHRRQDRKSTRLNSSHSQISYAVFCLKKKKITSRMLSTSTITTDSPRRFPTHRIYQP